MVGLRSRGGLTAGDLDGRSGRLSLMAPRWQARPRGDGVLTLRTLAGVALAAWVWLALVRGMYWRTNIRLPAAVEPIRTRWPSVAIIVPARDEVDVLPLTLSTLVAQNYRGRARVILVDDNSTDGTRPLVADRWPDITVIGPGEPPAWMGRQAVGAPSRCSSGRCRQRPTSRRWRRPDGDRHE